ncbi:MAG: hypothetical protein JJV95_00480 [Sulfurospirillum sp.]|nr:hypothetical protein [Sulfurospirillum sp.]MBL0702443.1 hypothetical protein [Sulfurospirillum sp.]
MVKFVVVFLFLTSSLWSTLLEDKIENFIGEEEYKTQKNLLHVLFKNEKLFLHDDNRVNDIKVLDQLKESGLLKLFYKKPQELHLSFQTKKNSLIFMRVINRSLTSMGYNYYLTKRVLKNSDNFIWEIVISTEHVVDPLIFAQRLEERGCFMESVERVEEHKWLYKINSDNITKEAQKIETNIVYDLKKPIKPYWINVNGIKSISFVSRLVDRWHPSIIFYDDKLHITRDYKKDSITNKLKLEIPIDTKYIKVTDLYTLDNIKRGISVYLVKRN